MAKKRIIIPEPELRRLYIDEQWSMKKIAEHFACSVQTICNLLRDSGIKARSPQHLPQIVLDQKIGSKNPMYGIKRPEHAALMSEKRKGVVFSEETKRRMSVAKNGMWGGKYIGPNHPRWLPPEQRKSPLYKQIRDCVKMQDWRKKVFERDNYTCKFCNHRGGTLNAGHIKQFALILKENSVKTLEDALECCELWELDNGRTLCDDCHRKTDTFAKKVNS